MELELHRDGQGSGQPVHVQLVSVESFGFEEDLVSLGLGKLHDLVFDRRTITRSPSADRSAVQRRLLEMCADDVLDRFPGPRDPARQLTRQLDVIIEGKTIGGAVSVLALDPGPIDAAHHGAGAEAASVSRHDARGARPVREQTSDHSLRELEPRELLEQRPHGAAVQRPVALRSRRPDGGTLRTVEHTELDRRAIGRPTHDAAEGIDLAHHGALRDPADGGIAGHLPNRVEVGGQEEDAGTEAGSHHRSLRSCMAGSHHDHVIVDSHKHKLREPAMQRLDAQTRQARRTDAADAQGRTGRAVTDCAKRVRIAST